MGKASADFEYEEGDRVRIWPVFKTPVGEVRRLVRETNKPVKYMVHYQYHDGRWFTDTYEKTDLTLVDRQYNYDRCTCGSNSSIHAKTCGKTRRSTGGSW